MVWLQALLLLLGPLTVLLVIGLLPGNSDERLARIVGAVLILLGIVLPQVERDVKGLVTSVLLLAGGLASSSYGWRGVWRWHVARWQRRWAEALRHVRLDSCILDAQAVNFVMYSIDLPRAPVRLRVARGPWRHGPRGGMQHELDLRWDRHEVFSNGAAALVSGRVRAMIERTDQLGGNAFEVVLRPGLLQIRATFTTASLRRRVGFVRAAMSLAAALQEGLMGQLVQIGAVEPSAAVCEICGEGVSEPVALCVKCSTPHHRECWEYNGRCSIYACGSTAWK